MEDGVLSPAAVFGSQADSAMDVDYMDELLLGGCWLETTDGSEFLNLSPSNSAGFFDSSFVWPSPEDNNCCFVSSPCQKSNNEEKQISLVPGNLPTSPANAEFLVQSEVSASENNANAASEVSRRWWIGPRANPGSGTSVTDRLITALGYIRDFMQDKDVLLQVWVPVNKGGRRVLTTHDQPFELVPSCRRLVNYRDVSVNYNFSAEKDSKESVGLPGRVFLGKVPEWSPDVRFFRSDEYPRVDHAQLYDIRGTLALPVFEQGSRTCLGVIEMVTTTQKIKYRPELESVRKALEAVDLRSSGVLSTETVKACDMSYQAALPEILKVLRSACETHRLPLAQTWVQCMQQGKGGCRHSDENYVRCVSTVDSACCIADPNVHGFHEACSEHHLLKGQGVVGEAFMTNQPCFSSDVTSFGKTEYPLSHHARMFGLRAAVAIRLRSVQTGAADFVLEFFLPVDCRDPEEQKKTLTSLSIIIRQVCHTLRVVTDKELEKETELPVNEVVIPSDTQPCSEEVERYAKDSSSQAACLRGAQQNGTMGEKSMECRQNQEDYSMKGSDNCGADSTSPEGGFLSVSMGKTGEKRRAKGDKAITLQVLQQYFAGSLKDAARSIGVCPTTLKRICRQHGITRWPSRKIKKVGHSLQKLQLVIDSVHGASSAFQIGSIYTNFPELASANVSRSSPSTSELNGHSKPSSIHPERGTLSCQVAAPKSPSSSCNHSSSSSSSSNSSSSHSCSSGKQQQPSGCTISAASKDPIPEENLSDRVLNMFRSEVKLHTSNQQEQKTLTKSHSHTHKSLTGQFNSGSLPPLPTTTSQVAQEIDIHRVKVTYGNEKIRFRMPSSWELRDLLQETARRFEIDDISKFVLKYLDDDSEWVLLTCNEDLEECIDVYRSTQNNTIKLSLQVSHLLGRSLLSNNPS